VRTFPNGSFFVLLLLPLYRPSFFRPSFAYPLSALFSPVLLFFSHPFSHSNIFFLNLFFFLFSPSKVSEVSGGVVASAAADPAAAVGAGVGFFGRLNHRSGTLFYLLREAFLSSHSIPSTSSIL